MAASSCPGFLLHFCSQALEVQERAGRREVRQTVFFVECMMLPCMCTGRPLPPSSWQVLENLCLSPFETDAQSSSSPRY